MPRTRNKCDDNDGSDVDGDDVNGDAVYLQNSISHFLFF